MSKTAKTWTDYIPFLRLATPVGFLKTAAALALLYLVFHLLGWREYTSFFSGTLPEGNAGTLRILLGLFYALAYFGFVLVVPILVMGAAVFAVGLRLGARRRVDGQKKAGNLDNTPGV